MPQSKDLQPNPSPFFPNIFFTNQFRTKPVSAPPSTDLTGQTGLVTGANQGLGLEASSQLLALNLSHLIIAVRSPPKGEAAARELRARYSDAKIDVLPLDMCSYASIQSLAAELARLPRLDFAVLNAGVRKQKFETVAATGHEETVQVNYLSTALLCMLLLPVLRRREPGVAPGKITIVGSGLALAAKFPNRGASPLIPSFDEEKTFAGEERYNVSKLMGMMFLSKLAERVSADDVVVNIVDPGFVRGTNLTTGLPFVQTVLFAILKQIAARTLEVGAATYVDAAVVKGRESHGCYVMSWKISPFASVLYTPEGEKATERLWEETLAELSFAHVQEILKGFGRT